MTTSVSDLQLQRISPLAACPLSSLMQCIVMYPLKDACNHSKVSSRAKGNQNLTFYTSAGKVIITCKQTFAHASRNQQGEYYRTFNSFKDAQTIIIDKAVDKEFHIKKFAAKRESIVNELAEKRLAGTSMTFLRAHSKKGGWFPAFRITPHPCQQS